MNVHDNVGVYYLCICIMCIYMYMYNIMYMDMYMGQYSLTDKHYVTKLYLRYFGIKFRADWFYVIRLIVGMMYT